MTDNELDVSRMAIEAVSDRAADLIKEAKPIEWIIEPLVVAGGITLLSGEPKRANKSLLGLHACICTAQGKPFLGLDTRQGEAVFCNFEDGRQRCANRLQQLGYSGAPTDPLLIISRRDALDTLLDYITTASPSLVVLDPSIEVECIRGVKNENDAIQIAGFLSDIREVLRGTGTGMLLVHHYDKSAKHMRGSSAFPGAVDGWIDITPENTNGGLLLSWSHRDESPMWMRVNALWSGEGNRSLTFTAGGTPSLGFPEKKKGSRDPGNGESERPTVYYDRIVSVLGRAGKPLWANEFTREFDALGWPSGKRAILQTLNDLLRDGLVWKSKAEGRRQLYELTLSGQAYFADLQPPRETDLDALLGGEGADES